MATSFFLIGCGATVQNREMINGVSYVASSEPISEKQVQPLVHLNANYASLMPFGFIRELEHPEIIFNSDRQWFGEREDGIRQYAYELKKKKINIMLKPQIWVMRGEFTGFIKMKHEDDWITLEKSYSAFIMKYAKIAQDIHAEIFCIGTELENFVDARPNFWKQLIKDVRKIYNGQLTYAANWNEYERTSFWNDLDFIGIDAYFPLDDKQSPTIEDTRLGWQKYKSEMLDYSLKFNKPILFTEFGYRSIDFAGKAPWAVDRVDKQVNLEAQSILMQVLFEEFWNEEWFAGGFVWKWFHNHENVGGSDDNRFSPQNKPAEEIIRAYYKNQ